MADSTYNILEYRCVIDGDTTHLYVLIDNPTDFMPIGGWFHKAISADVPSLGAMQDALVTSDFLTWDRLGPDAPNAWLMNEVKRLRDQEMELSLRVAQLMMRQPKPPQS